MMPSEHNNISFSNNLYNRLRKHTDRPSHILATLAWVSGFLMVAAAFQAVTGVFDATPDPKWMLVFGCGALLASMLSVAVYNLSRRPLGAYVLRRNVAAYLAGKSWAEVLRDLAPEGELWNGSYTAKVTLPTPPVEVAEIILKAHKAGMRLRVAAEADAISFDLQEVFQQNYQLELAREEAARRDPIIYVQSRDDVYVGAVAVLAQFGDFPIERAVIARIAKSENLFY